MAESGLEKQKSKSDWGREEDEDYDEDYEYDYSHNYD